MAEHRVFFYIGSDLHLNTENEELNAVYEDLAFRIPNVASGHAAAVPYFRDHLKPVTESWSYLLETSDNAPKQIKPTNMVFRLFDSLERYAQERPHVMATPRAWEFICSAIKKETYAEASTYDIARTGRGPKTVVKNSTGGFSMDPIVGFKSDCSGRVLQTEFNEFIDELKATLPTPVFSISDCNTFHTTGYLWGKVALDRAVGLNLDEPVLIVDLDQHNDYDKQEHLVGSDSWGQRLLECYRNGAYVVLGIAAAAMANVNVYAATRSNDTTSVLELTNDAQSVGKVFAGISPRLLKTGTLSEISTALTRFWTTLEGLINARLVAPVRFKHLFVTIDRDCMFGSRTQWGDASVTFESPAEVRRVVDAVVSSMGVRGVGLRGFDVTGLPDSGLLDIGNRSRLLAKSDVRRPARVTTELAAEIAAYSTRFKSWCLDAACYEITADSLYDDDSLRLEYSLKYVGEGQEHEFPGELDDHGKARFVGNLSDWRIRFRRSTSWSSMVVGTRYMLDGRYAFVVRAVV